MVADAEVLDLTQEWHDQIDAVHGKGLMTRAELGAELHYRTRELGKRDLTLVQKREVREVLYRIYAECMSVPEDKARELVVRVL